MPDNKTKNTCFASGYMEEMIMCGIVGYIGEEQAAPILLEGLEKLEYRGYDSADGLPTVLRPMSMPIPISIKINPS